jgi:hypothetical protein
MGQQHKKVIKRQRRKAYLVRKKERDKNGITLSSRTKSAEGVKAAAKKVAKKPAAKKAAAKVKKEDEVAAAPEAAVEDVAAEAAEA